ncbi:hypothetical protein M885DRAFT_73860 [Pelagophyceae sp. CCMP2097]|nr:hypothetical protein M885DRAFT_73860 [Pelagophyceae sp. CCMP2097]
MASRKVRLEAPFRGAVSRIETAPFRMASRKAPSLFEAPSQVAVSRRRFESTSKGGVPSGRLEAPSGGQVVAERVAVASGFRACPPFRAWPLGDLRRKNRPHLAHAPCGPLKIKVHFESGDCAPFGDHLPREACCGAWCEPGLLEWPLQGAFSRRRLEAPVRGAAVEVFLLLNESSLRGRGEAPSRAVISRRRFEWPLERARLFGPWRGTVSSGPLRLAL